MNPRKMTLERIYQLGMKALIEKLGPGGALRFLQQFEIGSGDCTKERHTWLHGPDVKSSARGIRRRRKRA